MPEGGVVSISWATDHYDQELDVIISYLRTHRDMVIVAAGGQRTMFISIPDTLWPAACFGVVSVAGSDIRDTVWYKSNYGYFIDLIAPAVNIFTMISCSDMGGPPADCYERQNGTSFAAPLVAGIAAWMRAVEPDLCAATIGDLLRESGDTTIWTPERGWGRPNAEIAVTKAANVLGWLRDTLLAGDVNQDWHVNEGDVIFLAEYIKGAGPPPIDLRLGDVDMSCFVDMGDLVYMVDYLYLGGPPPVIGCAEPDGEQNRTAGISFGEVPSDYVLADNYPNPFNPSTTIRFGLPLSGKVRLAVYNLLGQRVAILVDGVKSAGWHEVSWNGRNDDGSAVSSGIYFYRLETDEFTQSRKMLLIK